MYVVGMYVCMPNGKQSLVIVSLRENLFSLLLEL